uniref:ILEI/PANDER domain-containing protein n=1 Tax=Poecilia latipinna TaxID=48699 RepID=A0A3B3TWS7_9TELE
MFGEKKDIFLKIFSVIFNFFLFFFRKESKQKPIKIWPGLNKIRDFILFLLNEGPCFRKNVCPANHIGFFVQSGAANVVPPKICVNNNLALGTVMNNAGSGINIVVVNGKSGDVMKTDHFNMYSGSVEPLIEFLKGVETGSVVLMAVYDEGSTKLNEEARTLISDLGSSTIHSLGYRDNWVFVGGKGTTGKSNFEKVNDDSKNKYDNWPEMVEVEGCVPKYVE